MWGAIIGAVIAAVATIYSSNKSSNDADTLAKKDYYTAYTTAIAQADSEVAAAAAEAEGIKGQAEAEADAYIAQAEQEKLLLFQQAEESRQVAYENIEAMREESVESLRRLENEQSSWEAKARAKAAASGVRNEGSTGLYLQGMEEENDQQFNWLSQSYESGLDVAAMVSENEYNATRRAGEAALTAGQIKANAALTTAEEVAAVRVNVGNYTAEALRKKANAYLAAGDSISPGVNRNKTKTEPKKQYAYLQDK